MKKDSDENTRGPKETLTEVPLDEEHTPAPKAPHDDPGMLSRKARLQESAEATVDDSVGFDEQMKALGVEEAPPNPMWTRERALYLVAQVHQSAATSARELVDEAEVVRRYLEDGVSS